MSDAATIFESLIPLAVASAIGLLLGLEREVAHKPAGLRTQFLVAVATALFVLSGKSLGREDVGKIAANVLYGYECGRRSVASDLAVAIRQLRSNQTTNGPGHAHARAPAA